MRCGGETLYAKVYKEGAQRSFRQAVDYTENHKTQSSRKPRAMAKGARQFREALETAWRSAEWHHIDLTSSVRVPAPPNFLDSVLLIALVTDENGGAARRRYDSRHLP